MEGNYSKEYNPMLHGTGPITGYALRGTWGTCETLDTGYGIQAQAAFLPGP